MFFKRTITALVLSGLILISNFDSMADDAVQYCEPFPFEAEEEVQAYSDEEIHMLAQLVEAEAGDQDLTGKRYVVDVVLNRADSDQFPNTIKDVIYQRHQFSVIKNGRFDKVANDISDEDYEAVMMELGEARLNRDILYFGTRKMKYMRDAFKYQDHWFGR